MSSNADLRPVMFTMYPTHFFVVLLLLVSPIPAKVLITAANKYEPSSLTAMPNPTRINGNEIRQSTPFQNEHLPFQTSSRQEAEDNRPICPQFVVTYAAVQKATRFLLRRNAPLETQFSTCKKNGGKQCNDRHREGFVKALNRCVVVHSFSACYVGVGLFRRLNWIKFYCIPYFKDSRVGNCYLAEYLALNGYDSNLKRDVFYRESGIFDGKKFQCTAGKRAKLPLLKNRLSCRNRFRITPLRVSDTSGCALPGIAQAGRRHSTCINFASSSVPSFQVPTHIAFCNDRYRSAVARAFLMCAFKYGLDAVEVAAAAAGFEINDSCPAFRRDSWVGRCKADDYVRLRKLKLISINVKGYYVFKRPGLCKY